MKTALITGAASGIGLALSRVCMQKGVTVVMVDKDLAKLEYEANLLKKEFTDLVHIGSCDVTKPFEVEELASSTIKQFGSVDWIYNNAGIIGRLAPVWELSPEQLNQVMDVNLHGMINIIRAFMPYLLKQLTPSHIINMASLYAVCCSSQTAAYSMSKHAALALSESLYFDLLALEKPVHVSVVFPSFTDTALLSNKSAIGDNNFHESLSGLLSHSRPAIEVAEHIVQAVEQRQFYILPDKEVKAYAEERTHALVLQEKPHMNTVEKLLGSLVRRKKKLARK